MRRLFVAGLLLLAALSPAPAQTVSTLPIPYFQGPADPGAMLNFFNILIQDINNIMSPTFLPPVSGAAAANGISFTSSVAGSPVTLSTTGSDTNISLAINPKGNGSVIFFNNASTDQGLIQVGNAPSWFPAKGLGACPGGGPGAPASPSVLVQPGGQPAVKGYLAMRDWLGRAYYLVGCG